MSGRLDCPEDGLILLASLLEFFWRYSSRRGATPATERRSWSWLRPVGQGDPRVYHLETAIRVIADDHCEFTANRDLRHECQSNLKKRRDRQNRSATLPLRTTRIDIETNDRHSPEACSMLLHARVASADRADCFRVRSHRIACFEVINGVRT